MTIPAIRKRGRRVRYSTVTVTNWIRSNLHLVGQTYRVLDFASFRKLGPGLLGEEHPWVTGRHPDADRPIWGRNILFATPRSPTWIGPEPEEDVEIITKIGRFLALMVARSGSDDPEILQGSARRMPHAVNYIHGSVHFNGGFLIFNDFPDAMSHLDDGAFLEEIHRFARAERRELTLVMRERRYAPEEFAWFVCFVRARLPWYANGNGPTKRRVLYGTPSPYPAVNPINGSWVDDLRNLRAGRYGELARPPIWPQRYFTGHYGVGRVGYSFLERFHAWTQHLVISAKGFQGGLVFTSRRRIEPRNWETYRMTKGEWRASYAVSHPFCRIERARSRRSLGDHASSDAIRRAT